MLSSRRRPGHHRCQSSVTLLHRAFKVNPDVHGQRWIVWSDNWPQLALGHGAVDVMGSFHQGATHYGDTAAES
jgi:hypothetical protein